MKDRFKIEDAIQVQFGFEPPLEWIEDDEETETASQKDEAEEEKK